MIESPFATVRLRQRVTKGAGSRQKGLLMAFQLLADGRGAMAENQRRTPHPARARRGSVQRRHSSGTAKCRLT